MTKPTLQLSYDFLEDFGGNFLLGLIVKTFGTVPSEVVLLFPMPSVTYFKEHGVYLSLAPSHAAPCLINDILSIMKFGVKISVEYYVCDPI